MKRAAKPPVVLLHGAFCGPWSLENWRGVFTRAGYTVHAPALRFHDKASTSDALADTGLADYAADLEEEIADLDAPPILIGHGMGGLLAQMLAGQTEIAAAILLAPMAPWGVAPTSVYEISAAHSLLIYAGFRRQVVMPTHVTGLVQALSRLDRETRDAVLARLVPESGKALFEMLQWGLDLSRASEVDTGAVHCPLLVLAGAEDRSSPPATVERIAALYRPRATFETLPGMGHWLQGEPGWEAVAARALDWLKTLP